MIINLNLFDEVWKINGGMSEASSPEPDPAFTDHSAKHASNGKDPISPASIGAPTKVEFLAHKDNKTNPHELTRQQIGAASQTDLDLANDNLALKANIAYVNDQISTIGNATPKGAYATLVALQAAFPAGTTGIYVVSGTGHWYYWNGAAWTDGGVYQGTAIAAGSVTPAETNNQIPDTLNIYNLFNISNAVYNYYINKTTGAAVALAGAGYVTIDVVPGAYYFFSGDLSALSHAGAYFNAADAFVVGFVAPNWVMKTGNTKAIFRVPPDQPTITKLKFNFMQNVVSTMVIFQDASKFHDGLTIADGWFKNNIVTKKESPFISDVLEYINDKAFVDYAYVKSNGEIGASPTFWSTPLIPVNEGEVYLIENYLSVIAPATLSSRGAFLGADFKFISAPPVVDSMSPEYTVPANGKYMILTFEAAMINSITVKRISSPSTALKISKSSIYPGLSEVSNGWFEKAWTSFGDSITFREEWQGFVVSDLGLVHTNCGIGSTAVAGAGATAFWQAVRLDAIKAANPDVITILGGANDLAQNILIGTDAEFTKDIWLKDTNVFKGAFSYIIEDLLTWKPSLRIFILTTTWAHNDGKNLWAANGGAVTTGLTYTDFANACKDVALYYGIPIVDLHGECGFNKMTNDTYLPDDIHPNSLGGKRIAELVVGKLRSISPM
jgi:lysophospholipase L1-like esterase